MHVSYSVFSSDDQRLHNLLIVFGGALFLRLMYTLVLKVQCQKAGPPLPPVPRTQPLAASEPSSSPPTESGSGEHALTIEQNTILQQRSQKDGSLTFVDCSFTVKAKGGEDKVLLNGVSGQVKAGEVCAIMGPSGAGKTTLLNMLTLEAMGGTTNGKVTLNKQTFDKAAFTKHAAYVPQTDQLWTMLTCRQHVEYAMQLYQPSLSAEERRVACDELLRELGLTSCQHTIAGNALIKGLSGGQKRRLSLAVALAKRPSVIFLDEPTSGLDSAGAASVVKMLKVAAKLMDAPVLCTIHQPSASVFAGFDNVLVLSGGRTVYFGETANLPKYLDDIGRPVPAGVNSAEYVLDVCNKDFASAETVDEVLAAWTARAPTVAEPTGGELPALSQASLCRQVMVLLGKHCKLAAIDPAQYVGRFVILLVIGIFFPIFYIKQREYSQDQIINRVFLQFWITVLPGVVGITGNFARNLELGMLRQEARTGMYSVVAYSIASFVIELPMVFLLTLAELLPTFGIANWPWAPFWSYTACLLVANLYWEFFGQLLSIVPHFAIGLFNYISLWFTSLIVCGIVVNIDDVTWVLRWLFYIYPYDYIFKASFRLFWDDSPDYEGTAPCTYNATTGFCAAGYYCPALQGEQGCIGKTGEDILTRMHVRYPAIDPDADVVFNFMMVVLLGALIKLGYTGALVWWCR